MRGNPNPKKGKMPAIPPTDALGALINQLLYQRPRLYESDTQYNLTIGQIRLFAKHNITFVMSDDLGKYELVERPDKHITKRRI